MNITNSNFYSKNFQIFFLYLFFLTPIIIFFSKFFADLFLSIVAIYTLLYLIKKKNTLIFNNFLFFFIFIFYISLNLLINNFNLFLFAKSFLLIRFPLYMLFPLILNIDAQILRKKFKFFFLFPLLFFILNLYIQAFFKIDIFGNFTHNNYQRITSFFPSDEYIAGSYLFFIFSILFLVSKKFNFNKIILLSVIYFGIFLSGDRTPFIMTNLFLMILLFLNLNKFIFSKQFKIILTLIIILPTLVFSLQLNNKINLTSFSKYKNTFKNIRNDINASENEIGLKRWPYYGMAAKSYTIFKKNIMFGSTYKSYRNECRNKKYYLDYSLLTNGLNYDGCSNHPHNIYLEILSEQGLVGLILLILTIYNFTLLKNLTLNNLNKLFYLVFLIVYFFPLRPFGSFYTNFGLVMFASVISFYLIFNKIEKKL